MRVKILTFAFSCCYVPETAVSKTTRGTGLEGSQDQPFSAGDVRQDTKREDGVGRLRQYHGARGSADGKPFRRGACQGFVHPGQRARCHRSDGPFHVMNRRRRAWRDGQDLGWR